MNTDQTTASTPSYLAYYGMTREPFGSAVEDELFYAEPSRKQHLEILLHLTQYGNELMLITGPAGSGKTTLLQQFLKRALDTWPVARIEANGGINDQQLLEQLFQQLNLQLQADSQDDLLEKITHHYDALQRSARQGVIVVDDAEQLHIATLKNILALAALTNADNKPLVRIILFGTQELMTLLQDSQLQEHANIPQRVIDLQAFDREQTAHYILHRLSVANFSDTRPFTDSALHKIHKQSGGWPQSINVLAHELLSSSLPAKASQAGNDEIEPASTSHPLRNVAIGLFIAVIGGLLMFQDKINSWLEPAETTTQLLLPLPELTDSRELVDSQMTNTTETTQAEDLLASLDQEAPLTESGGTPANSVPPLESSEPSLADIVTDTHQQAEEPISTHASPDESEAKKELAEEQPASIETAKPAIPASAEPPAITEEALPKKVKTEVKTGPGLPLQQNEWLLQQNSAHFTLQLVAGNNIDTIRSFISGHGLETELALYQTRRDGKPWYVLLYGIYSDKPEAIDARDHLPQNLRKAKPWIRNLGSIQSTLQ